MSSIAPDVRTPVAAHAEPAADREVGAVADRADRALRLYLAEPEQARRLAVAADREAVAAGDWSSASTAQRVLGLVAGHVSDAGAARRHLAAAVRHALRAHDAERAAQARVDLAYVLARQGRTRAALAELEQARPHLRRGEAGRLLVMQALVLRGLGRWDEALGCYQLALPLVRRGGDRQALAVLLGNRGVVQIHRGALSAAERDLSEAGGLLGELGNGLHSAITWHNLGCLSALRGDVPEALRRFEDAERGYRAHREVPLELWRDRGELLLAAGLAAEARDAAARAVVTAQQRREPGELAEARLRLGQAALLDGDPLAAVEGADAAARAFLRQRRPGWAALARWTGLQGCLASDTRPVTVEHVLRAAARLERAGWTSQALEARLRAAQLAQQLGRPATARRQLRLVRRARVGGSPGTRQLGWQAEALLHLQAGDRVGCRRAAARGLAIVEQYRASLGATDLRALASTRVAELARLGLQAAVDDGRPTTVLSWAERLRAAHLARPRALPWHDPALVRDLAELRQVAELHRRAIEGGQPGPSDLRRRQAALERSVRDRARTAPAAPGDGSLVPSTRRELAAALGERALVEYVAVGDRLHALTLVDGALRLHPLAPLAGLERELAAVPFALRRLALHPERAASAHAARQLLDHAGERLDDVLLRPLAGIVGDRELVVVPTSPLHSVPWSLLASCRGRPVTVSPSATAWCAAYRRVPVGGGHVVLVAGPRLPHAEAEVAALSDGSTGAVVLRGAAATADAVLAAMEGAALVHIAAHCQVRADNPQFSALALADGPLTVYDLERLRAAPDTVVLSACESGRSTVLAGDELLGLTAALLTVGVRTLVASLVQVSDANTERLMLDVHAGLDAGRSMRAALAEAQQRAYAQDHGVAAAAAAFVCLGVG